MNMTNNLPSPKSTKKQPQVGRGYARRGGHTTGRGTKGQKSRSGYSRPRPGFEGGQMPLSRRLPKLKGFSRAFKTANAKHINLQLSELATTFGSAEVGVEELFAAGFINNLSKKISVKVLYDQDIDSKLKLTGIAVSSKARAAIEKAGGSVA
ncbi:50S ribosomal protein L15 [Candidatus Dojkabacteria bacterium]|uniref:Large ribosomal subunit protein uL15 n=1 Tax=Candidatus Dojkabacteria bacterium TaxID=2099670 RepID=A0A955L0H2_9BACT|nr:50S ribosomal protein L15 [Candidatus Dojkabacteria bacterium]